MSFLLDVIIVLIAALTIVFAVKNGFVKTVLSALSFVIALTAALLLRGPVVSLLEKTPIPEKIEAGVENVLSDILVKEDRPLEKLISEEDSPIQNALCLVGVGHEELTEWLNGEKDRSDEGLFAPFIEHVSPKISNALLTAIVFPALFLLTMLACRILGAVLTGLSDHIGALRFANKTLGLIVGIVLAAFRVLLFCAAAQMLLNAAGAAGWEWSSAFTPGDTILFKAVTELILPEWML